MEHIIVEAKSRLNLREYAMQIRKNVGFENKLYFPVVEFLDFMPEIFTGFHYEIVSDDELPKTDHAQIEIYSQQISIKNSVYEGACEGCGQHRMTIAHEIGHYLTLCISGFKLQRSFSEVKPKAYQSPEWQAKCFAGELLIAAHLVTNMKIPDIMENCGVSYDAAKYHYHLLNKGGDVI